MSKPVTANITTSITTSYLTLAAILGVRRAAKYSSYEHCVFTNRGSSDLYLSIIETQYTAGATNAILLASGETFAISSVDTGMFYVKGSGSGDSLDFYGEVVG